MRVDRVVSIGAGVGFQIAGRTDPWAFARRAVARMTSAIHIAMNNSRPTIHARLTIARVRRRHLLRLRLIVPRGFEDEDEVR